MGNPVFPSAVISFFGDNMTDIYVRLSYDPTGRNPDNLIGSEPHDLKSINGFPYKIVTMLNGGFYTRSLRVYDEDYTKLIFGTDYIVTYRYANVSERLGLEVCSDVVFLNPDRTGRVYLSAQMVGGDTAFSLTSIVDYVDWYNQQPDGYIPRNYDYNGNEPVWKPGELDKERWALDTYQPFNNEIYAMSRAVQGATGPYEQDFRDQVTEDYNKFLELFNDRLDRHIEDKDNPHVDLKAFVGLGLVENYALATLQDARIGLANNLFLTPLLSYEVVDQFAMMPLDQHIADRNNPHKTTPLTLDAPIKSLVDSVANNKYLRDETVADASQFTDGVSYYAYSDYYAFARNHIPAGNFAAGGANGYVLPQRMGRGSPRDDTILRSDGYWVSWGALTVERGSPPTPQVLIIAGPGGSGQFASQADAHNAAISNPWAYTAPEGSMIFYKNQMNLTWGRGNGASTGYYVVVNASYKSPAGWIPL